MSYYGSTPGHYRKEADIYVEEKGLKYPWFDGWLKQEQKLVDLYDAVWLCDDDIEADTEQVADLFNVFHENRLWIAQPALTRDSYYSFELFRCKKGRLLRFVNFVEAQMPVFSKWALKIVRGTMGESKSGWGIDLIWPKLLNYPLHKMAVIDAVSMYHGREVKSGPMYTEVLPKMGIVVTEELEKIKRKYGVDFDRMGETGEIVLKESDKRTVRWVVSQLKREMDYGDRNTRTAGDKQPL